MKELFDPPQSGQIDSSILQEVFHPFMMDHIIKILKDISYQMKNKDTNFSTFTSTYVTKASMTTPERLSTKL